MKIKRILSLAIALLVLSALLLSGCSRIGAIKLPPLPTPSTASSAPVDQTVVVDDTKTPEPTPTAKPVETPVATDALEPSEPPAPSPEPTPKNPNVPVLALYDATYPEDMEQYSVADLLGEVAADKGLIIQVEGLITDLDEYPVQRCVYYPYTSTFNLADTVNAELRFGVLQPGKYLYQLRVIAENNSYYTDELLINHPFEGFYP